MYGRNAQRRIRRWISPLSRRRHAEARAADRDEWKARTGRRTGHHGHVDHTVHIGDVGTVYGGLVSIDEQAEIAGTISYELLTRLGPRVVRRYGGEM
jgi:hypothetical protein